MLHSRQWKRGRKTVFKNRPKFIFFLNPSLFPRGYNEFSHNWIINFKVNFQDPSTSGSNEEFWYISQWVQCIYYNIITNSIMRLGLYSEANWVFCPRHIINESLLTTNFLPLSWGKRSKTQTLAISRRWSSNSKSWGTIQFSRAWSRSWATKTKLKWTTTTTQIRNSRLQSELRWLVDFHDLEGLSVSNVLRDFIQWT